MPACVGEIATGRCNSLETREVVGRPIPLGRAELPRAARRAPCGDAGAKRQVGGLAHADRADGGNAQGGLKRLEVDDEDELAEMLCARVAHEFERRQEDAKKGAATDTDHPDRA